MSPYLLIYIYVVFLACISWRLQQDKVHNIYIITMLLLCSFLALHYGQGSDYFAYENTFSYWSKIPDLSAFLHSVNNMHGEILWHGICWSLNKLNITFQGFIILLAIFEFYALHRYIIYFCQYNKMWGILLIFPSIYLTYMFGAIRQGLVVCIFMGYMLPFLIRYKLLSYYICASIMMLIHSSAIAFFIIPIIMQIKIKTLYWFIFISIFMGLVVGPSMPFVVSSIFPIIDDIIVRMGKSTVFLPAIAERTIMFIIITYLYYKNQYMNTPLDKKFYKIYIYSIMLYCLFINYSLTASRLSFATRTVEVALVIHYINKLPEFRKIICCIILTLNIIMCCKNLTSYIYQGGYKDTYFWNYPYVTIFNKEQIFRYW